MLKLLLLGDSIRMGYQKKVKEKLKGICEVVFDEFDNGRFSSYTYYQMNQLLKKYPDVTIVHFNTGYWDMNIESPMTENLTSINEYLYNFDKIISLGKKLGLKLIYATSLPINDEHKKRSPLEIGYTNEMIQKYNTEAKKLMVSKGVIINDLYEEMLDRDDYYKCPDEVHLTEEGYNKCADKIVSLIKDLIK